jgi:hypothetical protein
MGMGMGMSMDMSRLPRQHGRYGVSMAGMLTGSGSGSGDR